jgi:hypothetical protein
MWLGEGRPSVLSAVVGGLRAGVAAGAIDDAFVKALLRACRHVSQSRPAPNGSGAWSDDGLDDLASEALEAVGPSQIILAANNAANDAEFMGWLHTIVRSTLAMRARETPAGWVLRTVDDALRGDEAFVLQNGRWALTGQEHGAAWDGDTASLLEAAWSVETRTIRRSPEADKIQIAWRADTRAVCRAILTISGPLAKEQLGAVVAQRFNVSFGSQLGYLDDADVEPEEELGGRGYPDPNFEAVENEAAARWMLTQLTADERTVIVASLQADGLRDLGKLLGCGKDKAGMIERRVAEKLKRLAGLTADSGQSAMELLFVLVRQSEDLRHSPEDDGRANDL